MQTYTGPLTRSAVTNQNSSGAEGVATVGGACFVQNGNKLVIRIRILEEETTWITSRKMVMVPRPLPTRMLVWVFIPPVALAASACTIILAVEAHFFFIIQ